MTKVSKINIVMKASPNGLINLKKFMFAPSNVLTRIIEIIGANSLPPGSLNQKAQKKLRAKLKKNDLKNFFSKIFLINKEQTKEIAA